jgi:hypothetical protein
MLLKETKNNQAKITTGNIMYSGLQYVFKGGLGILQMLLYDVAFISQFRDVTHSILRV